MSFFVGFDCRECGASDLEAEVVIDSASSSGSFGLPEYSYPGEGCEWHAKADVTCDVCGTVHDAEWMAANLDAEVRRREAEPPEPFDA